MAATGHGRRGLVGGGEVHAADLEPSPFSPLPGLLADYYFGAGPPPVIEIPFAWLTPRVGRQPTTPINQAVVSMVGGPTAYAVDSTSKRLNGTRPASVTLQTATRSDPANLARFLVAMQKDPQPQHLRLAINLVGLTEDQALRVAQVKLWRRVRLTDTPPPWPDVATEFVVEGIAHAIAKSQRVVVWTTSTLIGLVPGTPGPWVRADSSDINGSDIFAY